MIAPYAPVNKILSLKIEGLDKFLDKDLLSLDSFSSLTYEIDANAELFRRKFEITLEYAEEHSQQLGEEA